MSSNRHCHLCQADVERLFGAGYRLTKLRDLVQPGQFACNERVTIETEKGKLTLRVVGPARDRTQVELALTDAIKLGLRPPIRMSGELEGSPGCVLSSGNARITLSSGVIVAARHLHMSPEEAQAFDLRWRRGQPSREGPRPATLDGFIVRSGAAHRLEAHIDTDEANACGPAGRSALPRDSARRRRCLRTRQHRIGGCAGRYAAGRHTNQAAAQSPIPRPAQSEPIGRDAMLDLSGEARRLITEDDVRRAARLPDHPLCAGCDSHAAGAGYRRRKAHRAGFGGSLIPRAGRPAFRKGKQPWH